jgi:hypothetical protein
MLPESAFALGGYLSIFWGAVFLAIYFYFASPLLFGVVISGSGLIAFGIFFVWVGAGARRERLALLETPKRPS